MEEFEQDFERSCRYDHGPLKLHTPRGDANGYHLGTYKNVMGPDQEYLGILISPTVLTVKIWKCPICGYIEIFDEPEAS